MSGFFLFEIDFKIIWNNRISASEDYFSGMWKIFHLTIEKCKKAQFRDPRLFVRIASRYIIRREIELNCCPSWNMSQPFLLKKLLQKRFMSFWGAILITFDLGNEKSRLESHYDDLKVIFWKTWINSKFQQFSNELEKRVSICMKKF